MAAKGARRTGRLGGSLAAAALATWALASGCAGQPAKPPPPVATTRLTVVLLPDESGRAGSVGVTTTGGTRELDQAGMSVRVHAAGEAPAAPLPMSEADVRSLFGAALAVQPAAPARFLLHFKGGSDDLVPASLALLPEMGRTIRERRAVDVSVIGHTDTVADEKFNHRLGLRRAEKVAQLLRSLGADPAMLEVDSHGEGDLLVKTGDGVAEPQNRRVEVTIR